MAPSCDVYANSPLELLAFELAEAREVLANVERIALRQRHNSEQVGGPAGQHCLEADIRTTDTRSG